MVKQDYQNYFRLAHILVKECSDKRQLMNKDSKRESFERKVFTLVDLFIRDSTLAQFLSRLQLLKLIRTLLESKL